MNLLMMVNSREREREAGDIIGVIFPVNPHDGQQQRERKRSW